SRLVHAARGSRGGPAARRAPMPAGCDTNVCVAWPCPGTCCYTGASRARLGRDEPAARPPDGPRRARALLPAVRRGGGLRRAHVPGLRPPRARTALAAAQHGALRVVRPAHGRAAAVLPVLRRRAPGRLAAGAARAAAAARARGGG